MFSIISPLYILSESLLEKTKQYFEDMEKAIQSEDEFIAVDNGSILGRDEIIKQSDIYIRTQHNLGYGGAINLGMKLATKKYFVIPNNDIRIDSTWREKFLKVFEEKPRVGAISYYQPGMIGSTGIAFTGLFWAMRREVYEKVGLFDTDYKLGGDQDRDYWCKMRQFDYEFDTAEFHLEHKRRSTYNQPEFRKRHGHEQNYSDSPFKDKWGFDREDWYRKDREFLKR